MTTAPGTWPFVGRVDVLAQLQADLLDPGIDAVVLTAPAGTGKTRLAREAVAASTQPAWWWQAAPAVAGVPFGLLADLLDVASSDVGVLHRLAAARTDEAGGVVVLDDAPHLDSRSADLLRRLVDGGRATVLATARSGVPVPAWLEWLWLGERTRHVELGPLDRDAAEELVAAVLDDVDAGRQAELGSALAERTGGNALFLRELVVDLRHRQDDGLPLDVIPGAPPHLARVLEARQRSEGPEVLAALRDVALAGSLPAALVEQLHGLDVLAAAERAALIVVDGTGATRTARPAHPLQGEVAVAALASGERRTRTIAVARAVLEADGTTAADRLAATASLVDQGAAVATDVLLEAARAAFSALDHELATRLAAAAVAAGDPFEAKVILGAAHSGADRPDAAERALRDALASAGDDDQRARAAGRLSVHLVAHGRRVDEASELLEAVRAELTDPAAVAFLAADRAKLASIRGDLTAIADDPDAIAAGDDELAVLNASIVGAYAQAMAGDPEACRATIALALPLAETHRSVLPWAGELVRFSGPFAALVGEGPSSAAAEAAVGRTGAERDHEVTVGTWRFLEGFSLGVAGHLDAATAALEAADAALVGHDLIGARPLAAATLAWVVAQTGDTERARTLLDRSIEAAAVDGRIRAQVAVADAWCDVRERGSVSSGAVAKVVDAALAAADGGQAVIGVIALHELVRLGAAARAVDPLRQIGRGMPPSWLLDLVTARATAEDRGDEDALRRLIHRAVGRWPGAVAELHLARHRAALRRGDEVTAARAAFTARRRAAELGDLVPWPLAEVPSPLTAREQDVVAAAAAGRTNREVAEASGVSVRTVENQLNSAYRKLGLGGRAELTAFLDG